MEWWTLILSAVAAIATVVLLAWGWTDRPRLSWAIREFPIDAYGGSGQIRISALEIYADGSGVAHAVNLQGIGCAIYTPEYEPQGPGEDDPFVMQMTSASPPLMIRVHHPADDSPRAVEIHWAEMRPRRARGYRLNLTTYQTARWRWHWSSLRRRGLKLVRLKGGWVPDNSRMLHSIPKTDPASLSVAPAPTLRARLRRARQALRGQWDRLRPFGRS